MSNKDNGQKELYKAIMWLWVASFLTLLLVAVSSCRSAQYEPYPSMFRYVPPK